MVFRGTLREFIIRLKFLFLPDGEDPDSLVGKEGKAAFEARFESALPLSEYLVAHLEESIDVSHADGKARFVPAEHTGADELPDDGYPFILVTGRLLEHWHTGVMTRRSKALAAIEPEAFADLHEDDATRLGLVEGDWVRVASRRGEIHLAVRIGRRVQPGSIFVPFHYREAGANLLTNPRLDPDGKIPEFKFCAVQVDAAPPPAD